MRLTKKFFATRKEANKYLKDLRKEHRYGADMWHVYDLKKNFPNRKKTRYFVGCYIDWLNI